MFEFTETANHYNYGPFAIAFPRIIINKTRAALELNILVTYYHFHYTPAQCIRQKLSAYNCYEVKAKEQKKKDKEVGAGNNTELSCSTSLHWEYH